MRLRRLGTFAGAGAGIYSAALLAFASSIIAARGLGPRDFGTYTLAIAAAAFVQGVLDLTVEDAAVKFGARFSALGEWATLRRLFAVATRLRLIGAAAAAAIVAGLSLGAEGLFGTSDLALPMLIAGLIPLALVPETLGAALVVQRRYGLRGALFGQVAALRLVGVAVGVPHGVTAAVLGALAGQGAGSLLTAWVGRRALRSLPAAPAQRLGVHRAEMRRFILQASVGSALASARSWIAPLIVGAVAGPVQAGYLRAAQVSDVALASLSVPARLILLGEHSTAWEHGNRGAVLRGVNRYMLTAGALMLVLVPPALLFAEPLVELVYSDAYGDAVPAVRLALGAAAVAFVFSWSKPFSSSIGRPGLRTATSALEVGVMIPLIVVLAREDGATGAATALLASALVSAAAWTVALMRVRRESAA